VKARHRRLGIAFWPVCAVNHPETGRQFIKVHPDATQMAFKGVWVEDESHPLGGRLGKVILHRRVNVKKDALPSWVRKRPFYEFVKEDHL